MAYQILKRKIYYSNYPAEWRLHSEWCWDICLYFEVFGGSTDMCCFLNIWITWNYCTWKCQAEKWNIIIYHQMFICVQYLELQPFRIPPTHLTSGQDTGPVDFDMIIDVDERGLIPVIQNQWCSKKKIQRKIALLASTKAVETLRKSAYDSADSGNNMKQHREQSGFPVHWINPTESSSHEAESVSFFRYCSWISKFRVDIRP